MSASNSEIYEEFRNESLQNIAQAEKSLLCLEKAETTGEEIHQLFRSIHTIKGSADYLGFKELKELSHSFENVLDRLRKQKPLQLDPVSLDLFFEVLDVIALLVANGSDPIDVHAARSRSLKEKLAQTRNLKSVSLPANENGHANKAIELFRETLRHQSGNLERAKASLTQPDQSICPGVRGIVSRALNTIGNSCQFSGEQALEAASLELKKWVLSPTESKFQKDLIAKIKVYLDSVQTAIFDLSKAEKNAEIRPEIKEEKMELESKTVRVDQVVLDGFMDLVGELIVARNASSHIHEKLLGSEDERRSALKDFRNSSNRLTQITGELQRSVMAMRMVQVKTLFERYPRIVRDVCRKNGKSVEVLFEGDSTEVDKVIADQITEPLIHLVRNAVDHGIESVDERIKLGKSESGTLRLKTSHQGNFMVIEVSDDGRGIDLEKIKSKIIERNLLTSDQIANASDSEILNYIFSPGFSTLASVNDISGRGVGLDVVNTCLKKLKGNVSISTQINEGTCFRLVVPLTMAIMRALLVQSDHAVYAIALQDVSETLKIRFDELKSVRQRSAITLRGEVVMVEWLNELLGHSTREKHSSDHRIPILILRGKNGKFGVIVDSVFKQEEIVVKPLPESYAVLQGLSGASILGDGKAILILDSEQLYKLMEKIPSTAAEDSSILTKELVNV